MAKTYCVTGVNGFIAGQLAATLLAEGHTVRGTARNPAKTDAFAHLAGEPRFSVVEAHLDREDGWGDAVAGCDGVFHVASPVPLELPSDPQELVRPAVRGVELVLRAAAAAGVRRVVLTSSNSAVSAGHSAEETARTTFTEESWTNLDGDVDAYDVSKTEAERAAWRLSEELGIELAAVHPTYVQGPLLSRRPCASHEMLRRILTRADPGVAAFDMRLVDIREVVRGHIAAMQVPEAAGERFILHSECASMQDVADVIAAEFPERNVVTRRIPYAVIWLMSWFDKVIARKLPDIGTRMRLSHEKAERVLGVRFRPWQESVIAQARSMIDMGLV